MICLLSNSNVCQRCHPTQICAESWHRGSKAAKSGVPFIPWLGLGLSRAGLVENCKGILASSVKSLSISSCISHWGRGPGDGWAVSHLAREQGLSPEHSCTAEPRHWPCFSVDRDNFPAAGGTEGPQMKGQTYGDGVKSHLCRILAMWPFKLSEPQFPYL